MTGVQGKSPSPDVKKFLIKAASDDPTRTNAEIREMAGRKFKWSPDITTIGRYRKQAGIPSSRTAKAATKLQPGLTRDERNYAVGLLDRIHTPDPNHLRLTDIVVAVGEGEVGPPNQRIHVRFNGKSLVECWLSEKEMTALLTLFKDLKSRNKFVSLMKRGTRIFNDTLRHNQSIDLGSGGTAFSELSQLLESVKPEKLGEVDRPAWEIWDQYKTFGKDLVNFKREIEDYFSPLATGN